MRLLRVSSPQINTARFIDIANAATGAVAAGAAYAGFTNPACTVFTDSNWTSPTTSLKYIKPTADDAKNYVVLSDDIGRDVEVTTFIRNGAVFLRVANGKAIYFRINQQTNTFSIGIATSLTFGTTALPNNYTAYAIHSTADLSTDSGFVAADTQGDTWTFGVDGFDVYAKFNGVEFFRTQEYRHMAAGQVALQPINTFGFRDITLTWLHPKKLRSAPPAGVIDFRDFGLKGLSCTGSISADSDQLTLNTNPGFQVGDPIIIATGGEAGAGERGTVGVGGNWPLKSYADATAMDADTSQVERTFAWLEDTGDVYQWFSGTTTYSAVTTYELSARVTYAGIAYRSLIDGNVGNTPDTSPLFWEDLGAANAWIQTTSYYTAKVIPRGMTATIDAIDGLVLTLDTNATNDTTDANIYYDNFDVINNFGTSLSVAERAATLPATLDLRMPEGNFHVSAGIVFHVRDNWNLYGAGKTKTSLISPDGLPSANVQFALSDYNVVRDFHLIGNVKDKGFGLSWDTFTTEIAVSYTAGGILFNGCNFGIQQDMYVTDVWQKAFGCTFCLDTWCYRTTSFRTAELKKYIQWEFQIANSTGGGCVDCVVDSDFLVAGFEAFGGNGQTFTDCIGRNASISANCAGSFVYDGFVITLETNSQGAAGAFSSNNPVININSNIGQNPSGVALGGTISNFTCTHEGAINVGGTVLRAIVVNAGNPNITMDTATITHPTCDINGGTGVDQNSLGTGLILTDITVIGTNNNTFKGNINVAADATYDLGNLTAERIIVGGTQVYP